MSADGSGSAQGGRKPALGAAASPKCDGGNNIRVAVRVRPFNAREVQSNAAEQCAFDCFSTSVVTRNCGDVTTFSEYTRAGRTFNFDDVFTSVDKNAPRFATQQSVFEGIGLPILENALDAYNGCLLAYGQTGAGKSHSIMGDVSSDVEKGLMPRACEELFNMVERRRADAEAQGTQIQAAILASYLEIYQEKMYDLLVSTRSDLQVRLHKDLGPHVPGLTQTPVQNMQEVHELLDFGAKNRVVGATSMNASSSRSHAVFTIDLRITITTPGGTKDLQSKVKFVDLAGSEKQKKTGATGERLQEGIAINQSLSALSRVIQALAGTAGKNVQPPFRESKLTLLLKDALSGNSRTVLLACISPSTFNLEESVSTLEFASRCKLIKTNAKKNEQDKAELIEGLMAEKNAIAAELEMEAKHRKMLQEELEKEMELSRQNQELAAKMQEEKQEIERQLKELESQSVREAKVKDEMETKETEEELKKAADELRERVREHEELQRENDRVKQEREQKQEELQRFLKEQEILEQEQQQKEEAMKQMREEQEQQFSRADAERKAALLALEESARKQEEEQRMWAQKHEEKERRTRELEEQLAKRAEADVAERERLEKEHQLAKENLEKERAEQEKRMQEAELLRQEREQQLSKVDEEKQKAEMALKELMESHEAVRSRHEELASEKERQAEELRRLEEEAASERERRKELEEREQAIREAKQAEIERLEKEKTEQLTIEVEKHQKLKVELQDKLEMIKKQEDERRRAEEQRAEEAALRQKIQEEVRKRKQREEALEGELKGLQGLSDSLKLEKKDLEEKAQEQKRLRAQLLTELGISGLGEDGGEDYAGVPRLMNMHPDPMLEGCLVYYLREGTTRVGADPEKCRICLTGLDVAPEVCEIENVRNVTLKVTALPAGFVRVNGTEVEKSEEGSDLANGDRLAIGRAHIFRAVIPRGRRKTEDMTSERQFEEAMRELSENATLDPKWRRGVDDAVMIVKRDHGTKQANELLAEAKAASETVAHANALLKEVPQDWADGVSHYELAVLFEADGLPVVCVVARASGGSEQSQAGAEQGQGKRKRLPTKGIWEAGRFQTERIPYMVQAIEEIQGLRLEKHIDDVEKLAQQTETSSFIGTVNSELLPSRKMQLRAPTLDDWQSYAWSEVLLARYNQLLNDHLEVKDAWEESEREAEQEKQKDEQPWYMGWFESRRNSKQPNQEKAQDEKLGFWSGLAAGLGFGGQPALPASPAKKQEEDGPQVSRSSSRMARKAKDKGTLQPHGENGTLLVPRPSQARARSRSFAGSGSQSGSPSVMTSMASEAKAEMLRQDGSSGHKVHVRRAAGGGAATVRGSTMSTPAGSSSQPPSFWPAAVDKEDGLSKKIVVPGAKAAVSRSRTTDIAQLEHVVITVPSLFDGKLGVRLRMENLVVTGFDVPKAAELGWRVGDEIIAVKGRPVRSKEDFRRELAMARNELPITFTVVRPRPLAAHGEGDGGYPAAGPTAPRAGSGHRSSVPARRQAPDAVARPSVVTVQSADAVLSRPMDTE